MFGFIIPNTFLTGPYFDDLKRDVLEKANVLQIVDFGLNQVFPKPNVFTALLFLQQKEKPEMPSISVTQYAKVSNVASFPQSLSFQSVETTTLESLHWVPVNSLAMRLFQGENQLDVVAWVKDVGLNYWTQGRGKTRGGSIADRVLYDGKRQHPKDRPYLKGRDVNRYMLAFGNHWLRHDWQKRLDPKVDTMRYSPEFLEREKIVYRQTADRIIATFEPEGLLTDKTLHTIVLRDEWRGKIDLRYLLGILNSRLLTYLYRDLAQEEGRTFAQVKIFRMKQLPVVVVDLSSPNGKARHDRMVSLVEQMLELHKRLAAASHADRELYQRQIDATDREIDKLVYELYGLTEEEIGVGERSG